MKFFEGWFERTTSLLDLNAQLEMASAAYRMFWISIASCVLSALALGGLLYSLGQTRKSIHLNEKSADETREINQAQARAYLYVSKVVMRPEWTSFTLDIENVGSTPSPVYYVGCKLEYLSPRVENIDYSWHKYDMVRRVLLGAKSNENVALWLNAEEKKLVGPLGAGLARQLDSDNHRNLLRIHGRLVFSDVFGNWFKSEYCFTYLGDQTNKFERHNKLFTAIQPISSESARELTSDHVNIV